AHFLARDFVDEEDAFGLAIIADDDFAGVGIGDDVEVFGGQSGREMDGGGLVIGFDGAAASAFGGPEAGAALAHRFGGKLLGAGVACMKLGGNGIGIEGFGQDSSVDGDNGHADFFAVLLCVELEG